MTPRTGRPRLWTAGVVSLAVLAACAPGAAPSVPSVPSASPRDAYGLGGGAQVRSGDRAVVVVQGSAAEAERYLRLAERAVAQVSAVVPWKRGPLVVEVPSSQAALERVLGVAAGAESGVSAVSTSLPGTDDPHVFVNPDVLDTLNQQGRQIVLTHETTHIATGVDANASMPLWLVEGFADFVALRNVELPLATTAGRILARVRKSGPPSVLPTRDDLDPRHGGSEAAYESAWLACRLLAADGGVARLVTLYDRVQSGRPLDAALRALYGFGTDGLTHRWQRRLAAWAH